MGLALAACGVNYDWAPSADVNCNPDNPVIGTRSFGADPVRVAAHVSAWVTGLQSAGVAACAKHFPGHGDTAQDSHLALPVVEADPATLGDRELVPFQAAVEAGIASVMTSHIIVPAIDPEWPATLSRPVLSLLRDNLSYDGVIISDALDMAGASADRGIPEAAVLSLAAGADLLCIGPDKDAALVREIQTAIVEAVRHGRLDEGRLHEAAAKVLQLSGCDDHQLAGARRAISVEGTLPDLTGAQVVSVTTAANIAIGEVPWGLPPDLEIGPDSDGVPGREPVILQVRDAHRRPEVRALIKGLADRPAVVVEWGWPGPYDGSSARICTRGYSLPGAAAVTELLREAGWHR
jgi:beta-N-acetylhexosaminidase